MAKTQDSAIQFIEAALLDFANQIGGTTGHTTLHRYAIHIFEGLASGYTDPLIEAAREHWDIDYSRAAKYDDGDGAQEAHGD